MEELGRWKPAGEALRPRGPSQADLLVPDLVALQRVGMSALESSSSRYALIDTYDRFSRHRFRRGRPRLQVGARVRLLERVPVR